MAGVVVMLMASTVIAAEPTRAVVEDTPTARELVRRLVAHGVTVEGIEKHFGKTVTELGDGDIPRLQQGLEKLRAKIAPQPTGGDPDFAGEKQQVRANVELWENRVRAKLQQVDRIVTGLDLRQIKTQKMAVDSLIDVLNQLDEEARSIIAAHEQVKPDLKLYREALLKAPGVFKKIADNLDKRATENKSTLIKTGYAEFASEARKLAARYEAQAAGVENLEVEVAKQMAVVQESREFISDVRELLRAIPASHGIETQKLVERLNVYIDVLHEAIEAMKGAANRIGEPQSPTQEPKPVPLTGGPVDSFANV